MCSYISEWILGDSGFHFFQAVELDDNPNSRKAVERLKPLVLKKQEEMKNEMIGERFYTSCIVLPSTSVAI